MTTPPIQTLTDELLGEIEKQGFTFGSTLEHIAREIRNLRAEIEHLSRFENAFNEWHDKTEWVQAESPSLNAKYLGCHRADVIRDLIESLRAENAELRKDAWRYQWLRLRVNVDKWGVSLPCGHSSYWPNETDTAIDTAMSTGGK